MSFNEYGQTLELIMFDEQNKKWDFAEYTLHEKKKIQIQKNPKKYIMCHSGIPKAITFDDTKAYEKYQKPIFAQYPFWPGFYGSVNDIVGVKDRSKIDKIMVTKKDTMKHIKSFTFGDTEELHSLRKEIDSNPKYTELIEKEIQIHKNHFQRFMGSIKSRNRYKRLLSRTNYCKRNQRVSRLR